MTRDEVLEQAADALASEAVDDAFATLREGPAIVRALKSKPPEKSPEVACGRCAAAEGKWHELAALRTADALECGRVATERDALRRQLPQYDCTHTGGPVSDSGGKHCPPESPCLTCRLERAEQGAREADAARRIVEAANARLRQEREGLEAEFTKLRAEVSNLRWQQSGSPMKGE